MGNEREISSCLLREKGKSEQISIINMVAYKQQAEDLFRRITWEHLDENCSTLGCAHMPIRLNLSFNSLIDGRIL